MQRPFEFPRTAVTLLVVAVLASVALVVIGPSLRQHLDLELAARGVWFLAIVAAGFGVAALRTSGGKIAAIGGGVLALLFLIRFASGSAPDLPAESRDAVATPGSAPAEMVAPATVAPPAVRNPLSPPLSVPPAVAEPAADAPLVERSPSPARVVVINGLRLTDQILDALEKGSRNHIPDGAYWYDRMCGAWGSEGGPTLGFIAAGLPLGGPLKADASSGTTSVFINGRQLHEQDVLALQQALGQVLPGRYWVDANGNCGHEGGPVLFNLVTAARARSDGGNAGAGVYRNNSDGSFGYRNSNVGIGVISDGQGTMMITR